MEVATNEPMQLVAGDTLKFKRHWDDYEPPGWTLTYYLVKDGKQITITATDNGDGYHLVDVKPSTTSAWSPGRYQWQAVVADGTDRYKVDEGTIEVLADYAQQSSGFDARTHVKKTLDAIEAVIESRATRDQESVEINGRSLRRTSLPDLLKLRDRYKAEYQREVQAERLRNGLGTNGRVLVRF